MKKEYSRICNFCSKEYKTTEKVSKFCSHSCSAKHGCKNRVYSEETKKKMSESLKRYRAEHKTPDFDVD